MAFYYEGDELGYELEVVGSGRDRSAHSAEFSEPSQNKISYSCNHPRVLNRTGERTYIIDINGDTSGGSNTADDVQGVVNPITGNITYQREGVSYSIARPSDTNMPVPDGRPNPAPPPPANAPPPPTANTNQWRLIGTEGTNDY